MQVDLEHLRREYSSLSDEALLAIDREDLIEIAQTFYDAELNRRRLASLPSAPGGEPALPEEPAWLNEAAAVYSRGNFPGATAAPEMENARTALIAAGIPCYLQLTEIPEDNTSPAPISEWRLFVPGNLNLRAASVLDRDIFNEEFEAEWRAHLETLSDAEVLNMAPEAAFCGLFDRIERVNRVYTDEIVRRGLNRAPRSLKPVRRE